MKNIVLSVRAARLGGCGTSCGRRRPHPTPFCVFSTHRVGVCRCVLCSVCIYAGGGDGGQLIPAHVFVRSEFHWQKATAVLPRDNRWASQASTRHYGIRPLPATIHACNSEGVKGTFGKGLIAPGRAWMVIGSCDRICVCFQTRVGLYHLSRNLCWRARANSRPIRRATPEHAHTMTTIMIKQHTWHELNNITTTAQATTTK